MIDGLTTYVQNQGTGMTFTEMILVVLMVVGSWRLFEKAGEPGWAAVVPFYNLYKLFQISTGRGWMFLILFLTPIGTLIGAVLLGLNLARAFGKSTTFALGLILFEPVFISILGFGSAQYLGPAGSATAGGYRRTTTYGSGGSGYGSDGSYFGTGRSTSGRSVDFNVSRAGSGKTAQNGDNGDFDFTGFDQAETVDFEVKKND